MFDFYPLFFQVLIVGASLFFFNLPAALVIAATVTAFIFYSLFIQNIQQRFNLLANNSDDREKGLIGDVFTNIDSVKYYGKEKDVKTKFIKASLSIEAPASLVKGASATNIFSITID